jgi:hypothetical protein
MKIYGLRSGIFNPDQIMLFNENLLFAQQKRDANMHMFVFLNMNISPCGVKNISSTCNVAELGGVKQFNDLLCLRLEKRSQLGSAMWCTTAAVRCGAERRDSEAPKELGHCVGGGGEGAASRLGIHVLLNT